MKELLDFINLEICERREYSATKAFEIVRDKIIAMNRDDDQILIASLTKQHKLPSDEDLAVEVAARFTGNSRGTPIAKKAFVDGVLWCITKRNAAEVRIEDLKKQLMAMHQKLKDEEYQNTLLSQKLTDLSQ